MASVEEHISQEVTDTVCSFFGITNDQFSQGYKLAQLPEYNNEFQAFMHQKTSHQLLI